MSPRFRPRLTYANVVASLALFVALGGTSYAAVVVSGKNVKNGSLSGADVRNGSLSGADVKNSSLTGGDVKNNSLTGADVKSVKSADVSDGSLEAKDFRAGQLPQGPRGNTGQRGPAGADATALWAVAENGTLLRASNPSITASANGVGSDVDFKQDISGCAIAATNNHNGNASQGTVSAAQRDDAHPTEVRAEFFPNPSGNLTDATLSVAVFC